jgi:hypothetical protein
MVLTSCDVRVVFDGEDAVCVGAPVGGGFVSGNTGFIRVDDEYAVFFEFGTGPVGAKNPHPLHPTYTTDAWYTKADGKPMDELYGWTPLTDEDGETYYLTIGQKAKPFMYETALQLRDEFPKIVKEVFG